MLSQKRLFATIAVSAALCSLLSTLPADAVGVRSWSASAVSDGLWSNPQNWDGGLPIANGDYLRFGDHGFFDPAINDLNNVSITRLTVGGGYGGTIKGNPITVTESLIAEENSGVSTIESNILGKADTLIADGTTLKLSGHNTFTGQIDVHGRLIVGANDALGTVTGPTKIQYGGQMQLDDRDLTEPIQVIGSTGEYDCAIISGDGTSILRDIQVSEKTCFAGSGTLSFPNGIGQLTPGFDLLLTYQSYLFGGTSNAVGALRLGLGATLNWNSTAAVDISSDELQTVKPTGDLFGSGTATSVDFSGGTFAPGSGNATGRFRLTGAAKIHDATLRLRLNAVTAGSGYSFVEAGGPVTIGPNTALDVVLGFIPSVGTQFRIIDNTGNTPISGTFVGLPEGATFLRGGRSWSITYKGGTGNDVVISAQASDPRPFKRVLVMLAAGN